MKLLTKLLSKLTTINSGTKVLLVFVLVLSGGLLTKGLAPVTDNQNGPTIIDPTKSITGEKQDITVVVSPMLTEPETIAQNVKANVKSIKMLDIDLSRSIAIMGPIMNNAVLASQLIVAMNKVDSKKPIHLLIDSPGGSVVDGAMLVNAIQQSKAPVYTVCMEMCASMAAIIHQYGAKRYVLDRTLLLFHPATVSYAGDVDRIKSFISQIQSYTNKMEVEVATRLGLSFVAYKNLAATELWIDSEQALKSKYVDGLVSFDAQQVGLSLVSTQEQFNQKYGRTNNSLIWIYDAVKF